MPYSTVVNGAAGTILVKNGGGQLHNVIGVAAGTSYAFIVKDGPDVNGNYRTMFGATPIPVAAGQNLFDAAMPMPFTNGLSFTVSGTPGEFDVLWA
jgi:hypothetical protein